MKDSNRPPAPEFADVPTDDAPLDDAPLDPLDEAVAAYLDGELAPQERDAFERRLAAEPDLRRRVDEERSAWDALELLDADAPNPALTETTVDRLNSETQNELAALARAQARRRRRRFALNYGAATFCAVLGFFVFSLIFPDVSRRRERDCRVVERLAQLETIGDFDYLTRLAETKLFDAPRPNFGPFGTGAPGRAPERTANSAPSTTPKTFEELSQDRVFYRLQQKFERLDAKSQARFRELRRRVDAAPNAERLWRTLDVYCDWISAWPNENDRERLSALPVDERVAEVRRLLDAFDANARRAENAERRQAPPLERSPTVDALRDALPDELRDEILVPLYRKYDDFLQTRGRERDDGRRDGVLAFLAETPSAELLAGLSPQARTYLANLSDEKRSSAFGLLVSLSVCEQEERSFKETRPFQNFGRVFGGGRGGAFGGRRANEFSPFRGDSTAELAETLRGVSPETRDFLTSLPAAEARGRLWALHWGFAPDVELNRRPPFSFEGPNPRFDSDRRNDRQETPNRADAPRS